MFRKILIANRGEIAVRIAQTADKMGISTVAVFADDDNDSLHIRAASESCNFGSGGLTDTYLNMNKMIDIAKSTGCDAIHPGYGFLSENPLFAESCRQNGIIFIGPSPEVIRLMGDKHEANRYVNALNIPVIESFPVTDFYEGSSSAINQFPVLVKAASGGGGKGMRIVKEASELKGAIEAASLEALLSFGDGIVYIEKLIEFPRHIEVQILGDNYGNVIHLFERECSLQRRHQKIFEEAPAVSIDSALREKLTEAAVKIARSVAYSGAGTIEFLLDANGNFYFLEMNTRIQVEHPVTELITGLDIVREQILIAAGNRLNIAQKDVSISGHAIEARLYAENPAEDFQPSPGKLLFCRLPDFENIRIDSGIESGYEVKSQYDPMLAKVISFGNDRIDAINNLQKGLSGVVLHGIENNLWFLKAVLKDENFLSNSFSTTYIEENLKQLKLFNAKDNLHKEILFLMAASIVIKLYINKKQPGKSESVWQGIGLWRHLLSVPVELNRNQYDLEIYSSGNQLFLLRIGNQEYKLTNIELNEHILYFELDSIKCRFSFSVNQPDEIWLSDDSQTRKVIRKDIPGSFNCDSIEVLNSDNEKNVFSPMHGKVLKVLVSEECEINKNEILFVIDSMKTENKILSQSSGKIRRIYVKEGDQVKTNMLLAEIN